MRLILNVPVQGATIRKFRIVQIEGARQVARTVDHYNLKHPLARSLCRFNERRNITTRDCPNAVILAGPLWLPWLAHNVAPDLWSVRSAIFSWSSTPKSEAPSS